MQATAVNIAAWLRDLAAWLRDLGLERYEQVFLQHDIRADVLPDLTEPDLEKLGISLGDRKRLLKAIAARRDQAMRSAGGAGVRRIFSTTSLPTLAGADDRRNAESSFRCPILSGLRSRPNADFSTDWQRVRSSAPKASSSNWSDAVT